MNRNAIETVINNRQKRSGKNRKGGEGNT